MQSLGTAVALATISLWKQGRHYHDSLTSLPRKKDGFSFSIFPSYFCVCHCKPQKKTILLTYFTPGKLSKSKIDNYMSLMNRYWTPTMCQTLCKVCNFQSFSCPLFLLFFLLFSSFLSLLPSSIDSTSIIEEILNARHCTWHSWFRDK